MRDAKKQVFSDSASPWKCISQNPIFCFAFWCQVVAPKKKKIFVSTDPRDIYPGWDNVPVLECHPGLGHDKVSRKIFMLWYCIFIYMVYLCVYFKTKQIMKTTKQIANVVNGLIIAAGAWYVLTTIVIYYTKLF